MSTLAAARADNFYFGPNYDMNGGSLKHQWKKKVKGPRKESRLDKYKIKSGPKIRFETPFHVKCTQCGHMIAKGVRFNAARKEIGQFHSTTILQFLMLCPSCKQQIICKTDPENCDYVYSQGANRILDTSKATDMDFLEDPEVKKQKMLNPLLKLESEVLKVKKESLNPVINDLIQYRLENWKDDFDNNLMLRRKFKEEKQQFSAIEEEKNKAKNFGLPMEDLTKAELAEIKDIQFDKNQAKKLQIEKRREIMSKPILPSQKLSTKEQQQLQDLYKKVSNLPAAVRKQLKAVSKIK